MLHLRIRPIGFNRPSPEKPAVVASTEHDDPNDRGFDWSPTELDVLSTTATADMNETASWLRRIGMDTAAQMFEQ